MAGLFVMLRFIKKRVAPAQFESRQYSTLKSAIEYVDYPVTLDSNAYVAPFSYYANNYLPISDIKKYGIPISITAVEPNGQPSPISITPSTNGNYRYTIAATAGKVVVTVAYLKF